MLPRLSLNSAVILGLGMVILLVIASIVGHQNRIVVEQTAGGPPESLTEIATLLRSDPLLA